MVGVLLFEFDAGPEATVRTTLVAVYEMTKCSLELMAMVELVVTLMPLVVRSRFPSNTNVPPGAAENFQAAVDQAACCRSLMRAHV